MVTRRTTTRKRVVTSARLLSLAPYPPFLTCPPMSDQAMHILKPLIALGNTGDYQVNLLFPASSPDHAQQVKNYLEDRRGIARVEGVVCQKQWNNTPETREFPDGSTYLYDSPQYREALKRLLQDGTYEVVVVETSYMAWTLPLIRKAQPRARIVLDLQNVEHLTLRRVIKNGNLSGQTREKYLSQYHKTLDWEKKYWPSFDYCMAVSPVEAELFCRFAPGVPVEVVVAGGGVRVGEAQDRRPYPGVSPFDLAFVGTLWYPNTHGLLWFIEKVLPRVRGRYPNTKLHIVGSGSPSGRLLNAINGQKSVVFWGQLRDERSLLAGAGIFVAPLFMGAGTRVKIMTAWSLEMPVVTTTIGVEGLSCKQGIDILTADTPDQFADCITRLLSDLLLREAVGRNGRRLVEEKYSEQVATDKIISFFNNITRDKSKNK